MGLSRTYSNAAEIAFEYSCKKLLESTTEKAYLEQLASIREKWSAFGLASYLNETWLGPYKEQIVSAWCDRVTHFGHHTSNR